MGEEGVESPGAVSILGWLFEMNNYFSCCSTTFVCEIKGNKHHDRGEFQVYCDFVFVFASALLTLGIARNPVGPNTEDHMILKP